MSVARDPQEPTKRQTIKYLAGGAVVAACPIPMEMFFAHSDAEGGISEYSSALRAADRATGELRAYLGQHAKRSTVGAGA